MTEAEGVARIAAGDRVEGAGFLVRADVVITCEHVVRHGSGWTVDIVGADGTLQQRVGTVTESFEKPDIAVLTLDREVPTGPARLAPFHALRTGQPAPLRAFGFPWGFERGRHAGELKAIPALDLIEVQSISDSGQELVEGFSGTGVYRPMDLRIVGMVTRAHPATRSGTLVPVRVLCDWLPWLTALIPLGDTFPGVAYAELVGLLGDLRSERSLLSGLTRCDPPTELPTALAQIEFLAGEANPRDDDVPRNVQDAMLRIAREQPGLRAAIDGWLDRWIPLTSRRPAEGPANPGAVNPGPADPGAVNPGPPNPGGPGEEAPPAVNIDPPSVVVRIDRVAAPGRRFEVTAWALFGDTCVTVEVPRADANRMKLEDLVTAYVEAGVAKIPVAAGRYPVIEFVLDRKMLLDTKVERWILPAQRVARLPVSCQYPVVVREVSRFEEPPRPLLEQWDALHNDGDPHPDWLDWLDCTESADAGLVARSLISPDRPASKALHTRPTPKSLDAAIDGGAAVMIWTRWPCRAPEHSPDCHGGSFSDMIRQFIASRQPVTILDTLRQAVRELRVGSAQPHADHPDAGRDVVLLWDDPDRRPPGMQHRKMVG